MDILKPALVVALAILLIAMVDNYSGKRISTALAA